MKIVFMGTPDFAVPCLQALLDEGENVAGVFTQPDKPKGRGYQKMSPPVKELAEKYGLPVYQPATLKDGEAYKILREISPDLVVVVAYGNLFPKELLELPPLGCVNVHASLLPRYRGAGPIQWCVINGETETGVTTMYMGEGLDTGDMILKKETPIGPEESAGELHDRLAILGANCLRETIRLLRDTGTLPRTPQRDEESCYAPMLTKELGRLDFQRPAQELHDLIRGVSPWPVAHTTFRQKRLKVYRTKVTAACLPAGVLEVQDKRLMVGCGEGALELLEVQMEGAKRMAATDFINGKRVVSGEVLGE